jgi:zinc transport system substrate-binding protein
MRYLWVSFLFINLLFLSCTSQQDQATAEPEVTKSIVVVSNYPLKYFTERIVGSLVDVQFHAKSAGDPAYWQPAPEDVVAMQKADLIFLNGASYEQWLNNVTLPESRMVETSAGFTDQLIPLDETVTHSHGLEGEHEHAGTAFTTWLDMSLAVEQAKAIQEALTSLLPDYTVQLEENFNSLKANLQTLDEELNSIVSKSPDQKVIFSHPVYQYLERRYQIKGMSVHWEPDQVPDAEMWDEFEHILDHHPAKWMIWEGDPNAQTVAELGKRGVKSVVFDPCGNKPETGDFLTVMADNMEVLKKVYLK